MAQHGGPRPNSGRKPGSPNKKTQELQSRIASEGITPLEFLLNTMRNVDGKVDFNTRLDAAKAAAPYIHAKLSNVDMTAKIEKDVTALSDAELLSIAAASSANSSEETEYSGLSH